MSPDSETIRATQAFMARLADRYPISHVILFGSRARLQHQPESDVDLAIVICGAPEPRTAIALEMADIAFTVLLETGILIEALPLWENELQSPEQFSNPALIRRIYEDGIWL